MTAIDDALTRQRAAISMLTHEERSAFLCLINETFGMDTREAAMRWLFDSSDPARKGLAAF